jgi:hypothetical protein
VACLKSKRTDQPVFLFIELGLILGMTAQDSEGNMKFSSSILQQRQGTNFEVQLASGRSMKISEKVFLCEPAEMILNETTQHICHCMKSD